MTRHGRTIGCMLILGAIVAADTSAQYPGGGQGGTSRRGSFGNSSRIGEPADRRDASTSDSPASLVTQVQVQLDRLEDDLKITNAQQLAWDAFAARMLRYADDVARERFSARQAPPASMSALQQFEHVRDSAQHSSVALGEVIDAGRSLYAALAPDQQATADRRLAALVSALANGAPLPVLPRRDERTRPSRSP